jgi:hypothetical protein
MQQRRLTCRAEALEVALRLVAFGLVEYTGASIRTVPGGTSFIQRARGAASTRYSDRTDACVDELTRPSISPGEQAHIRRQRLKTTWASCGRGRRRGAVKWGCLRPWTSRTA